MQSPLAFNKEETDDKFLSWSGGEQIHLFGTIQLDYS